MKTIYFVLALLLLISITEISYSQYCDSCGSVFTSGVDEIALSLKPPTGKFA